MTTTEKETRKNLRLLSQHVFNKKERKNYSLSVCEDLIQKYVNKYGGECTELQEGTLGLGTILLHGGQGRKTIVIQEYYINCWTSGHHVTKYNKMPKKYAAMLEEFYNNIEEE